MEADPLTQARERATLHRRELTEQAGPMLTKHETASLLGGEPPALDQMREASEVLAVRLNGEWSYPSIQFNGAHPHPSSKTCWKHTTALMGGSSSIV